MMTVCVTCVMMIGGNVTCDQWGIVCEAEEYCWILLLLTHLSLFPIFFFFFFPSAFASSVFLPMWEDRRKRRRQWCIVCWHWWWWWWTGWLCGIGEDRMMTDSGDSLPCLPQFSPIPHPSSPLKTKMMGIDIKTGHSGICVKMRRKGMAGRQGHDMENVSLSWRQKKRTGRRQALAWRAWATSHSGRGMSGRAGAGRHGTLAAWQGRHGRPAAFLTCNSLDSCLSHSCLPVLWRKWKKRWIPWVPWSPWNRDGWGSLHHSKKERYINNRKEGRHMKIEIIICSM